MSRVAIARVVPLWLAAMTLLSSPAAAQKSAYVAGFRDLERTMLTADAAGANAAIDRMAGALSVWEVMRIAPGEPLLADEVAEVPALPPAAYADGFARIARAEYREALPPARAASAGPARGGAPVGAAGRLAQPGRHDEEAR